MSGLVFCSTARDVRGSPTEQLAALAAPPVAAALQWNPVLHAVAVLLQVTGMDTAGALHSRGGGPAILAEADDTAWRHIAPVIARGLTRPEPGHRRGQDEDGPAPGL